MIRPVPYFVGSSGLGLAIDQLLAHPPIRDQLLDRNDRQLELRCDLRASCLRFARSPVSFRISQSTPAGISPAIRARSTAASVCPARRSTPPSFATSGNKCPGRVKSAGLLVGSQIA